MGKKLQGPLEYKFNKVYKSEWTRETAGGCSNYDTSSKNPKVTFVVRKFEPKIIIQMKAGPEKSIGFTVRCVELVDENEKANFSKKSSGDYNRAYAVLELENIQAGRYTITPTTFLPNETGVFILEFSSNISSISI